ncbi:MAG: hypothetical protein ACRDX8_15000, partial [Acidimicrobiales bacterium]
HAGATLDGLEGDVARHRLYPGYGLAVLAGQAIGEAEPVGLVDLVDPPPAKPGPGWRRIRRRG